MTTLIFTSEWVLSQDDLLTLQAHYFEGEGFEYLLTSLEMAWLDRVRTRYSIADWIEENITEDVLRFEYGTGLNEALIDDDCGGKAPMLSDNTALQRIFFYLFEG